MNETPAYLWILVPALFAVTFPVMWLAVTSLLGAISGWFRLQRAFPDRPEIAIEQLRGQTAMLGIVSFKHCLRFDICPGGLRIAVTRLLGIWQRPFFVPWSSIEIASRPALFRVYYRLGLGRPEVGSLSVSTDVAERIARIGRLRLPAA